MYKKMKGAAPEKEFYYYVREDEDRHPRITVCLAVFEDNTLCRGIALCSFSEKGIDKKRGRVIARNRAMKAYMEEHNSCYISREEARKVMRFCGGSSSVVNFSYGLYGSKSHYDVRPTEFEEKILGSAS